MYSTASILSACINWATNYNDRFFIERFIDLKSLGIYSLLSTITSLTEIGYFALGSALQPFIFEYYKENNTRGVQKLYQIFILLSVCMVSFIILFGSNLNLFIQNPGYLQVVNYLSLMAIGYIFSSLYYLFNLQIIYSKKSKYFIYLSLYLLGTSLLLNTALIPKFGIWGAVAGSTIAKLLSAFTIFYFARKSLKLPFEKRNYYMILLFLGVITGFWLLSRNNIISYNLSGILQFISVIAIVFILSRKMLFEFYNLVIQKFRKPVSAD
jgi:O-antigen/teichoic acid export membrane protein